MTMFTQTTAPKFNRRGVQASGRPWDDLRRHLDTFWNHFGGKKCDGSRKPKAVKIRLLRQYADIIIGFSHRQSVPERREKFDALKRRRHQMRSHGKCFGCGETAEARHHIIQIQNGGHDAIESVTLACLNHSDGGVVVPEHLFANLTRAVSGPASYRDEWPGGAPGGFKFKE